LIDCVILFEEIDPNMSVRSFVEEAMQKGCGVTKRKVAEEE